MNKVNRILKYKDILDIVYSIEGYYYYNQETYIEMIKHIENFLEIIEVQTGTYLKEDDIIRFNDNYGR